MQTVVAHARAAKVHAERHEAEARAAKMRAAIAAFKRKAGLE